MNSHPLEKDAFKNCHIDSDHVVIVNKSLYENLPVFFKLFQDLFVVPECFVLERQFLEMWLFEQIVEVFHIRYEFMKRSIGFLAELFNQS